MNTFANLKKLIGNTAIGLWNKIFSHTHTYTGSLVSNDIRIKETIAETDASRNSAVKLPQKIEEGRPGQAGRNARISANIITHHLRSDLRTQSTTTSSVLTLGPTHETSKRLSVEQFLDNDAQTTKPDRKRPIYETNYAHIIHWPPAIVRIW